MLAMKYTEFIQVWNRFKVELMPSGAVGKMIISICELDIMSVLCSGAVVAVVK